MAKLNTSVSDQQRRAQQQLERLLLRGLESPASEWGPNDVVKVK